MTKWCDLCPQEDNSCDECKNKPIQVRKIPRDQKKRLKEKAKTIRK